MSLTSRLSIAYKALTELGFESVALNGLYRFGLATGHYKRMLNAQLGRLKSQAEPKWALGNWKENRLNAFPTAEEIMAVIGENGKAQLIAEADEIVAGKVRLFGGELVELTLKSDGPPVDWTDYENGPMDLARLTPDIKFLWEPARFGWAFSLGRAYRLTQNENYPQVFWKYFEEFTEANPPYLGPQWMSGQEAALRVMAFAWAGQMFAGAAASTPERQVRLSHSIGEHAARIPPTLVYARSQRNNHLLVEAAGLLTASLVLPIHPQAPGWRETGWKWLNRGVEKQIDGYGEYSQHSSNYHRLMLQVVLWAHGLARGHGLRWTRPAYESITRSVHWLLALLDPASGQVPNLGANDGAYILPLTVCSFQDYRPVLYAAGRAFLDYNLPGGPWDEMCLWFGVPLEDKRYVQLPRYLGDQLYGKDSWAYFRIAQFTSRPSHADQLHLDLWWRGLNIARDGGTYRYNAAPPWDNGLTTARVHNTVTVDGEDQMTRAGRFLYLDWVNAYRQDGSASDPEVVQRVRGRYRNSPLHYRHTRIVSVLSGERWRIEDELLQTCWWSALFSRPAHSYRLHWLLPDWQWEINWRGSIFEIRIKSPDGWVTLKISGGEKTPLDLALVTIGRAGEIIYRSDAARSDSQAGVPLKPLLPEPVRGWFSPTYDVKVPALSLAVEIHSTDDVQFISEFLFP